ncbi:MAG TPA: YicC family protein [Clostridia bacterium]|nr:YicC family protein [Clostridia bacterium]
MPKSMTGYGRGESQGCGKRVTVEMKSVNHRYLEIQVKMPKQYYCLEERIRNLVKQHVARGRVDVLFNIEEAEESPRFVKVDKELAIAYHNSLKELAEFLQIPLNITLFEICQLPDIIQVEEAELDPEVFWPVLQEALLAAVKGLVAMRQAEGEQLARDLRQRQQVIRGLVDQIDSRAQVMPALYQKRIQERLQELLAGIPVDEQRVALEVAILAERSAIDEELVRLRSHLTQLAGTLQDAEPVGRKLDFLVQEMHREINTIGAKANDLEISQLVVAVKSELEKIREQVQNLE